LLGAFNCGNIRVVAAFPEFKLAAMKFVIISIILFKATCSYNQTTLLRSQVYDFDIGDVFMTAFTEYNNGGQGYTDYRLDTIKTILTNTLDTFKYVTSSYTFYSYFSWPANTYSGYMRFNDTITISGMDSMANHYAFYFCAASSDTVLADPELCDALAWTETAQEDSCWYESSLVEGCGGPYYYNSVLSPSGNGYGVSLSLIYFNKSGIECGQIVTGNEEIENVKYLKLYPNPVDQFIYLDGVEFNDQLTLYSIDGHRLHSMNYSGQPVTVEGLNEGIYFLQISSGNNKNSVLKFVKK
jgi:hypothetical protein